MLLRVDNIPIKLVLIGILIIFGYVAPRVGDFVCMRASNELVLIADAQRVARPMVGLRLAVVIGDRFQLKISTVTILRFHERSLNAVCLGAGVDGRGDCLSHLHGRVFLTITAKLDRANCQVTHGR